MTKRRSGSVLCIGNNPVLLNLRCSLVREDGWDLLSSGSGHDGILQFSRKHVDIVVVDMNDDGSEAALIAGEVKRLDGGTRVILIVPDGKVLIAGATEQADAVLLRSEENDKLIETLRSLVPKT